MVEIGLPLGWGTFSGGNGIGAPCRGDPFILSDETLE